MTQIARELEGPFLKIKRAQHHINDLHEQMHEFFGASDKYRVFRNLDGESGQQFMYAALDVPMPAMWPLIIGDATFNLISGLDQLYVALVEKNGKTPSDTDSFPIARSAEHFNRLVENGVSGRVGQAACEILQNDIKPYPIKDGDLGSVLNALKALRNYDGHNFLIPTGSAGARFTITTEGSDIAGWAKPGGGRDNLQTGIKIGNLEWYSGVEFDALGNAQPKPEVNISGQISFGDIQSLEGKRVIRTLKCFTRTCSDVFIKLHPIFT